MQELLEVQLFFSAELTISICDLAVEVIDVFVRRDGADFKLLKWDAVRQTKNLREIVVYIQAGKLGFQRPFSVELGRHHEGLSLVVLSLEQNTVRGDKLVIPNLKDIADPNLVQPDCFKFKWPGLLIAIALSFDQTTALRCVKGSVFSPADDFGNEVL